ncbi:unnamed protein product [Didymodactylos carnosus]|uniref:Uncharacterized protein n=1 Tax=Didymodactylos carnosus TaxID=1234261 RepID=A0A8S2JMS8_9BILA|nr:unnamed protein product [Didymodactylos carnosus]CAF3818303.1 unnamed protein product [Didymodactylos carnosus]
MIDRLSSLSDVALSSSNINPFTTETSFKSDSELRISSTHTNSITEPTSDPIIIRTPVNENVRSEVKQYDVGSLNIVNNRSKSTEKQLLEKKSSSQKSLTIDFGVSSKKYEEIKQESQEKKYEGASLQDNDQMGLATYFLEQAKKGRISLISLVQDLPDYAPDIPKITYDENGRYVRLREENAITGNKKFYSGSNISGIRQSNNNAEEQAINDDIINNPSAERSILNRSKFLDLVKKRSSEYLPDEKQQSLLSSYHSLEKLSTPRVVDDTVKKSERVDGIRQENVSTDSRQSAAKFKYSMSQQERGERIADELGLNFSDVQYQYELALRNRIEIPPLIMRCLITDAIGILHVMKKEVSKDLGTDHTKVERVNIRLQELQTYLKIYDKHC